MARIICCARITTEEGKVLVLVLWLLCGSFWLLA